MQVYFSARPGFFTHMAWPYTYLYMCTENQHTVVNYKTSSPAIPPLSQTFIGLIHMDIIDFVCARWRQTGHWLCPLDWHSGVHRYYCSGPTLLFSLCEEGRNEKRGNHEQREIENKGQSEEGGWEGGQRKRSNVRSMEQACLTLTMSCAVYPSLFLYTFAEIGFQCKIQHLTVIPLAHT